jgi:SpoVK/Ycf46/Vps4 family AAA+-type ATPase
MGPPGTGKTAIAEAIAKEANYTYVRIRNLRNMFVGETERRTESLMMALRELAPVIVLRDEVDEDDSGRDSYQGDSGVSGRVRQQWMTFLSDPTIRGRVVVISISNRPDRLDAALKRSGRADLRIPVLMPDHAARRKIFKVMFRVRYKVETTIDDFDPFATATDGLSGAEIERITLDSYTLAVEDDRVEVNEGDLLAAINDFIPSVEPAEVERMTQLAIKATSHKRYLPKKQS